MRSPALIFYSSPTHLCYVYSSSTHLSLIIRAWLRLLTLLLSFAFVSTPKPTIPRFSRYGRYVNPTPATPTLCHLPYLGFPCMDNRGM